MRLHWWAAVAVLLGFLAVSTPAAASRVQQEDPHLTPAADNSNSARVTPEGEVYFRDSPHEDGSEGPKYHSSHLHDPKFDPYHSDPEDREPQYRYDRQDVQHPYEHKKNFFDGGYYPKHDSYYHHEHDAELPQQPSNQGCGGSLPPLSCPLSHVTALRKNPGQQPVPNDRVPSCYTPGARYAWSAECAEQMDVNGTCMGSAYCQPGDATVPATARCTATGWKVTAECYPAGCSQMPPPYERPFDPNPTEEDPNMFAECAVPAYFNQECTAPCKHGGMRTATAVCKQRKFPFVICYQETPFWDVQGDCLVNPCQTGTPVPPAPPAESGPVLFDGRYAFTYTTILPDHLCNFPPRACNDTSIAVFRIEPATTKRSINVSTCGVTNGDDTVIEVRRIDVNRAGVCKLASLEDVEVCATSGFCDGNQGGSTAANRPSAVFTASAGTAYLIIYYKSICLGQDLNNQLAISQRTLAESNSAVVVNNDIRSGSSFRATPHGEVYYGRVPHEDDSDDRRRHNPHQPQRDFDHYHSEEREAEYTHGGEQEGRQHYRQGSEDRYGDSYHPKHESYYNTPHADYPKPPSPSNQGCLGSLPPLSCSLSPATALRNNPGQQPVPPCSSPGAKYAWSSDCAKQMAVNGTCMGSAYCDFGGATVNATAVCTAAGWRVTDGCWPAGCSNVPQGPVENPNGTVFTNCSVPGHINQVCTATCEYGGMSSVMCTNEQRFCCDPCLEVEPSWVVTGTCRVNVCQAGTLVPPVESGPVMYQGQVYFATYVIMPDAACGCDEFQQSQTPAIAVFRIEAATVNRVINVSTCGVDDADGTIIEVRRNDVNGAGTCAVPAVAPPLYEPEVCSSSGCCGPCDADNFQFRPVQTFQAVAGTQYIVLHYNGRCISGPTAVPTNITISQRYCGPGEMCLP